MPLQTFVGVSIGTLPEDKLIIFVVGCILLKPKKGCLVFDRKRKLAEEPTRVKLIFSY